MPDEKLIIQIIRENHVRSDGAISSPVTMLKISDDHIDMLIDAVVALRKEFVNVRPDIGDTQQRRKQASNYLMTKQLENFLMMARYPRNVEP